MLQGIPSNNSRRHSRKPISQYPPSLAGPSTTSFVANAAYQYSYVFEYPFEVPAGAKTMTMPDNDKIHIKSITASDEGPAVVPAQPLYDTLER